MNLTLSEAYEGKRSLISKADARAKLALLLAFILATSVVPPTLYVAFAALSATLLASALASRISLRKLARRMASLAPLLILLTIFLPFFKQGNVIFSLKLGIISVSVKDAGLLALLNTTTKSLLCVAAINIFISTTSFPELLKAMQAFRVPRVFVMLVSFMYRYAFVLIEEAKRMEASWHARYFGKRPLRQIAVLGQLVGTLFLRTYERSERIYTAMLSRGYDEHGARS